MAAVLFTCAGQRVDIVSAFARAGATTVAADLNELAPALYHAHHRAIVPPIHDPRYVAPLHELAEEHDVNLSLPRTDLDHLELAHARGGFPDTLVLVSEPETVERCSDKYL